MTESAPTSTMLPALSGQTALERKYTRQILKADPGIGEKSVAIANSLADAGLPGGAAAMILQAVYTPTTTQGLGQGTRIKWFVEAVQNRYAHKLDVIRSDYRAFRSFLADIEEVIQMRDELKGNGYPISFQGAFILWEVGQCADSIQRLADEYLPHLKQYPGSAMKRVVEAAMAIQNGTFNEMGTALEFLNPQSYNEE